MTTGRRGPRAAHSRAGIAAAAVAVADAEGLPAVTIRRVAAELGLAGMSLYSYVPDKSTLLALMADAVAAEHDLPAVRPEGGRAALALVARQQRELMLRHPWLPELLRAQPPLGPNTLAVLEFCLGAMDAAGVDPAEQLESVALLVGFVGNFVAAELARRATPANPVDAAANADSPAGRDFRALVAGGDYPRLAGRLAAGGPPWDDDTGFERLLGRMLEVIAPPPAGRA